MKNFKKLLALVLVTIMAFAVVGCNCGKEKETPTLTAPVVTLTDKTVSWTAVENATSYDVYSGTTVISTISTVSFDLSTKLTEDGTYSITVIAKADGYNSSVASNAVSYTVVNFSPVALDTVLGTYKNNAAVQIEEVVFAKVENGFFVSSSVGAIYVNTASYTGSTVVAVGDKVQVTGKYGYVNNFPQIKNVTEVTVVSSGNNVPAASEEVTVGDIAAYDAAVKANYAKLVKVQGFVDQTGAAYTLRSESGTTIAINGASNTSALEGFVGKRVEMEVVVYKYESDSWSVIFTGAAEDIHEKAIPQETVEQMVTEDITGRLTTECYEAISLPKTHSTMDSITYTWSCESEYLTITNNKASFVTVTEVKEITLTVTVKYETVEFTQTYKINSHPIVVQTVAEFRANEPTVSGSTVKLTGTIVTKCRNEGGTIRGFILVYEGESVQVDFYSTSSADGYIALTDAAYTDLEVGDNVTVTGHWRSEASGDRPTVEYVSEIVVNSKNNPIDLGKDEALELTDAASYKTLADNITYYCGRLVKIVNPFLSGSSSSSIGNYVRFGYAQGQCSGSYGADTRIFSFLTVSVTENVGSTSWLTPLDLGFSGAERQYEGLTIYAYVSYLGNTVTQFIIPGIYGFESTDVEYMANIEFSNTVETTINAGMKLELPTTVLGETITWSDESGVVDVTTGMTTAEETTQVNLKAVFTKEGQEYTIYVPVTVIAMSSTPITVTELVTNGVDGSPVRVKGTVIAFNSDGNTTEERNGVILMDEQGSIVYIDAIGTLYGKTFPNYVDKNGDAIAIGDVIEVVGIFEKTSTTNVVQEGRYHVLGKTTSYTGSVTKLAETGADITTITPHVVITTNEELVAAFANPTSLYGKIIKITGTAENLIYIGNSSSSSIGNIKVYMNSQATDATSAKVNGSQWISLKGNLNCYNLWEKYWEDFGFTEIKANNDTSYPVVGDMYMVLGNVTGTYFQMMAVNASNFTAHSANVEKLASKVTSEVAVEVEPSTVTLPATYEIWKGHEVSLTWSSTSEYVTIEGTSCTYSSPAENTTVTLTATFNEGGVDYTANVEVLIKVAAKSAINVSAITGTEEVGDKLYVQGVVVGLTRNTNAGVFLILKDCFSNTFVTVSDMGVGSNAEYTMNGLAVGDVIAIDTEFTSAGLLKFTGDTAKLAEYKVSVEGAVTSIDKTDNNIIVVETQDQFTNLFASDDNKYKLVKLVNVNAVYYDSSNTGRLHRLFFTATKLTEQKMTYNDKALSPCIFELMVNAAYPGFVGAGNTCFGTESKDYAAPETFSGDLYVIWNTSSSTSYIQLGVVGYDAK